MSKASESKTDVVNRLTDILKKAAQGDYAFQKDFLAHDDEPSLLTEAVKKLIDRLQQETSTREKAEQTLRKTLDKFQRLEANIPGMVYTFALHPDGTYSLPYVSPASRELFGLAPEEMMRDWSCIFQLLHPDDHARLDQSIKVSAATLEPWRELLRFNISGEVRSFDCMSRPDPQPDGNIHWDGIAVDITERKHAEEALEESEARFRSLMDHMPGVAIQGYRTDGTVLYWNKASEAVYGYSSDEAVGKNLEDLIVPADLKPLFRECLAVGAQVIQSGEFMPSGELMLLHKDGHLVPVYSIHTAVFLQGKEPLLFCLDVDLSERKRTEEALRTTRQKLADIIEFLPDATFVVDRERKIIAWNKALEELTRTDKEDFLGKGDYTYSLPFYGDKRPILIDTFFEPGADIKSNYVMFKTKGHMVFGEGFVPHPHGGQGAFFWGAASPLLDNDGNVVGAIESVRDITDQKRAEDSLRESEERFRQLAEVFPETIFEADLSGNMTYANAHGFQRFGFKHEDLERGLNLVSLIAPADVERVMERVQERLAGKRGGFTEYRALCKNGDTFDALGLAAPILREGRAVGLRGFVLDISQRKRAEEALRESEERFRQMAELLPEGIYELGPKGKITYANGSALEQFGYAPSDIVEGISAYDVVIPAEREIVEENARKLLQGGKTTLSEYTGLRKDGSTFPVVMHSAPVVRDGRIVGARGVCVNMTERKHLEAQLVQAQKMECVGRLAGGVAHDFNNMLAVILGSAELVKSRLHENDPLLDHVSEIERAACHSREITSQLLAFSRKQIIAPRPLNLNDVVSAMKTTLARLIGEDIDLRFHPGKDTWKINADPSQIDQILVNLAVNARDAMPRGGKLVIETANAMLDEAFCQKHPGAVLGAYVRLRVSDNGVGMDEETLAYIFEPFFTTKEIGKGTGLGLATVYGIVKQNDGFLDVISQLGQGATFEIYLPRLSQDERIEGDVEKAPEEHDTGTVLLVEDNPMVRNITTEMLEIAGHKVLAVTTAQEALKLCQEECLQIDLLLTDVVLPGMSGRELKDRLEATRPGFNTLFMSGYPSDVIAHHGVLEPGTHFIQKPFKIHELKDKVQEAMRETVKSDKRL